jgi:hypothetical protein
MGVVFCTVRLLSVWIDRQRDSSERRVLHCAFIKCVDRQAERQF